MWVSFQNWDQNCVVWSVKWGRNVRVTEKPEALHQGNAEWADKPSNKRDTKRLYPHIRQNNSCKALFPAQHASKIVPQKHSSCVRNHTDALMPHGNKQITLTFMRKGGIFEFNWWFTKRKRHIIRKEVIYKTKNFGKHKLGQIYKLSHSDFQLRSDKWLNMCMISLKCFVSMGTPD